MEVLEDPTEFTDDNDSDEELQQAFLDGKLKPGLNFVKEKIIRPAPNDEKAMLAKLESIRLNLPWLQRLDLTCKPAPLAPELKEEIDENNAELAEGQLVENDFKRETYFYRIGQQAVLEGIPRLHELGIPTKRPVDYLAQMVKTDQQMDRVRKSLLEQKNRKELSEKARRHRDMRKQAKQKQAEAQQRKAQEKRQVLERVKQFRRGQEKSLDFLDDMKQQQRRGKAKSPGKKTTGVSARRKQKNEQFGFGGRKRGQKRNTADSAADMSWALGKSQRRRAPSSSGPAGRHRGAAKRATKKSHAKNKRPGKANRQKMKTKSRK